MKYIFSGIALLVISGLLISDFAFAHGMSEEDKARILNAGYSEYIELGAVHMLTGYDHLLFLFGVIFFLTRFFDIVKFVTAFTIGHSLTLVFATIYGIQANYYLIDAVIALTVCYKAFDNLDGFKKYLSVESPNLMAMVFVFGLIHGFGLSTRLQQLPLGDEGLVLRILSFNVGVELGQIAALAIMLIILSGWRKSESFTKFSQASNVLLILLGGLLLLMQLHGYSHSSHPDEFPLNKDDHAHVHQAMEVEVIESETLESEEKKNIQAVEKTINEKVPEKEAPEKKPSEKKNHHHSHDGKHYHSH